MLRTCIGERIVFLINRLNIHMQKNEVKPLALAMYENQLVKTV
jgi:hypothetical protein